MKNIVNKVVKKLGIEEVPIVFDASITDDSRLELRPTVRIVINEKHKDNFIEYTKCIVHEYRHLFQIFWARLMNDDIARRWKEELSKAISSSNLDQNSIEDYYFQELEIDAIAFTQVFLKQQYGIIVIEKNEKYQQIIDLYKIRYKHMM